MDVIVAAGLLVLVVYLLFRSPSLKQGSVRLVGGTPTQGMFNSQVVFPPGDPADSGRVADAMVESVRETETPVGLPLGASGAFFKFGLLVTPPGGGVPYQAETVSTVPTALLSRVQPGAHFDVLVDPARPQLVVPDWTRLLEGLAFAGNPSVASEPITTVSTDGTKTFQRSVTVRKVAFTDKANVGAELNDFLARLPAAAMSYQIPPAVALSGGAYTVLSPGPVTLFVTGVRGTATVTSAEPLGRVRDINPSADPAILDDMLWQFAAEISLPGRQPHNATFSHHVPASRAAMIAPGMRLAVAVDDTNPPAHCAIDWEESPLPAA